MPFVAKITLIWLFAGVVGTGCGGLLTFFWRRPSNRSVSLLLGLAGGVMLAVVVIDLIPQAIFHSNFWYTVLGVFIGLLLLRLMAYSLKRKGERPEYIETGILVGLGIALHNFPEGLAIGAGYAATARLGLGLAVVIALHNFPEGLSMATPMKVGGWSSYQVLGASLLPGLPMGFGAFCGAVMSNLSPLILALNLGVAGGGMLYIVVYELIPKAYNFRYGLVATCGLIIGLLSGLLLVTFL